MPERAGDIHDVATGRFQVRTEHICCENLCNCRWSRCFQGQKCASTGVVHQHVKASPTLDDCSNCPVSVFGLCRVGKDEIHIIPVLGNPLQWLRAAACDEDS